jgi:hypothetical protein
MATSIIDKTPIDPSVISQLATIGAKSGHSTQDIKKLARAIHRLM